MTNITNINILFSIMCYLYYTLNIFMNIPYTINSSKLYTSRFFKLSFLFSITIISKPIKPNNWL